MQKREQTRVLLFTTTSLWMLLTAAPVLEEYLPILRVQGSKGEVPIPLDQALNLIVGFATFLSSFAWLHSIIDGRWPLWAATPFLFFTYFVWTGHGIHAACVIAERLQSDKEAVFHVFVLLDFLHETVSHNMFVGGFCGMLMVIMYTEVLLAIQWYKKEQKEEDKVSRNLQPNWLLGKFFTWLWPLVIGLYFSIFASRTDTMFVTALFFVCVAALAVRVHTSLSTLGLSSVTELYLYGVTNIITLTTFFKASVVGVISLLVIIMW